MHDNTKLLLLIFLTLTIGTVAIILSLRPTKNTEEYKSPQVAGSLCFDDKECKSQVCGQFNMFDPPPPSKGKGRCCSAKEHWYGTEVDWDWDNTGEEKMCTKLGTGSACSYAWQCNSHSKYSYNACWDNKCR